FLYFIILKMIHGVLSHHFNNNKRLQESDKNEEWMKNIRDDVPISQITIPGSHDALARHWGAFVKCQSWSFENQLMAGVRYFDLRVSDRPGNDLNLVHGIFIQFIKLGTVIEEAVYFLGKHPSETILIRVKLEGPNKNKINNDQPLIRDVRGKIVLLKIQDRYDFGIDLDSTHRKGEHKVKDVNDKWNIIQNHLLEAKNKCNNENGHVILLYSSGTGVGSSCNPITPKSLAKIINEKLCQKLAELHTEDRNSCFGIIAMDFPGLELIKQIIKVNESKCKNDNNSPGSKSNGK
uniref:Si:dkey-152b24.7 n=1 Tax=Scleropages formosus TaxID=113540 RepID=A0A8C9R764_SCLFO